MIRRPDGAVEYSPGELPPRPRRCSMLPACNDPILSPSELVERAAGFVDGRGSPISNLKTALCMQENDCPFRAVVLALELVYLAGHAP